MRSAKSNCLDDAQSGDLQKRKAKIESEIEQIRTALKNLATRIDELRMEEGEMSIQFDGVKLLAGNLNAALEAGAARIQIEAYGGAPGDKSSDARRLSLKRALAVRQLLIDDGVPSSRIDVRAMGGVDDKGPVDRVDVFVRAS